MQKEDALRNKLNEANKRSMSLGTELEESRQNFKRLAELEQEARKKLEADIEARKQAVVAYMQHEAWIGSSGQSDSGERARSVESASYIETDGQYHKSNLDIFPDASDILPLQLIMA